MGSESKIAVLGAGLAGCCAALEAAKLGYHVTLFEKQALTINGASLHNEGKLHLGYVYGADPEAETHEIMAKGSLCFASIIERLTSVRGDALSHSTPFIYGVPHDSQLSYQQQLSHFQRVDECISRLHQTYSDDSVCPAPSYAQPQEEFARIFDSAQVSGGIQTDERSVNTAQVANIVSAAVLANPLITLMTNVNIEAADHLANGKYRIDCQDNICSKEHYDGVINCLWEDRVRLDKTVDIEPTRSWLVRYKAAISGFIAQPANRQLMPSATLVTGAYGDVVNHGDGRFYLSWYPECKLGESQSDTYPDIEQSIKLIDERQLVEQSIEAMAQYIPNLANVLHYNKGIRVGGGYIFAWGQSDITDPNSGLHQRHLIGPIINDRWVSVNTGKYCTAPMFGVEAAQTLHAQLN